MQAVLDKLFGSRNDRALRKVAPALEAVKRHDARMAGLDDAQLKGMTGEFRRRHENGEPIDDLLPEAYAAIREASRRVLNMRHFDCQIIGGVVLHRGMISEMKTGEGKTLVSTLPAYLNALGGKGVHVVTVNDYLARRDAEWMGGLHHWMGLSVGVIQHDLPNAQRRAAYASDITYGTNNEFGFDYLRDNMKFSKADFVQRGHHFAIVDEVDSILIDEARTPLIISGPAEEATDKYYTADGLIGKLRKDIDYKANEESHSATLNEEGIEKVEQLLKVDNIYDPRNIEMLHCVQQALRAHALYRRDKDYVVKDGEVIIVDEHTGRLMPGRRWSDGLHQAVEAKERVKIERENQTLATITLQNYFRMYVKLAGMTGTASTEEMEFRQIYGLAVVTIPTNKPIRRTDHEDAVYRTAAEKWTAVIDEISDLHSQGRPILVGTASIESSEMLASRLKRKGIQHVVLNAKLHEREAEIVAQAGRKGAVTVATNMAGRGTDILLGGNPEHYAGPFIEAAGLSRYEGEGSEYLRLVLRNELDAAREIGRRHEALGEDVLQRIIQIRDRCKQEHADVVAAGGLAVVGTERHEARRIDNQLRGRSGRQGDPGTSRFFLSLEDDLMRIFASDRMSAWMKQLGMEEGVPIEHRWVTKAIASAQEKVEANNYGSRKHLLDYDDVMNQQRKEIYSLRTEVLEGRDVVSRVQEYARAVAANTCDMVLGDRAKSKPDTEQLADQLRFYFGLDVTPASLDAIPGAELRARVVEMAAEHLERKRERLGAELFEQHCQLLSLRVLDEQWKDHLQSLDHVRDGISLRGYGQRDPRQEYKKESYELFRQMGERIEEEVVRLVYLYEPITQEMREAEERKARERLRRTQEIGATQLGGGVGQAAQSQAAPQPSGPPPAIVSELAARARAAGQAPGAGGSRPPVAGAPPPRRAAAPPPAAGRNEQCPCGSGKKYKKCCGQGVA